MTGPPGSRLSGSGPSGSGPPGSGPSGGGPPGSGAPPGVGLPGSPGVPDQIRPGAQQPWRDLTTTGEHERITDPTSGGPTRPGGPAGGPPGPSGPVRSGTPVGGHPDGAVSRLRDGARSELRRQLREVERWRRATVVVIVLLVLGAYPSYLLLQAATRDQVLNSLDTLDLPSWSAGKPTDTVFGSRWCIGECRFRERSLTSQRGPDETAQVYERVLSEAGWNRWQVARCPEQPVPGFYTCWKRDEYTLDLWVRDPPCAFDPVRNRPTVGPSAPPASAKPDDCTGSAVTIKVRNGIADDRLRGGSPPPPPEDPDFPNLTPSGAPVPSGTPR